MIGILAPFVIRAKLKSLRASMFPDVPPDKFEEWRVLELRSNGLVFCAMGSLPTVIIVGFVALETLVEAPNGAKSGVVLELSCAVSLMCLVWAALVGSKAAKLKKTLGINWSEQWIPPVVPARSEQGVIANDLQCSRCGQSLRGVPTDTACPTCGTPAGRCVYGNLLCYADCAWLTRVRLGLGMLGLGWILFGLVYVLKGDTAPFVPRAVSTVLFLLAASLCFLSFFFITSQDLTSSAAEYGMRLRRMIRLFATTDLVGTLGVKIGSLISSASVAVWAGAISGISWVVALTGLLAYLGSFASRVPDKKLAQRTRYVMWAFGGVCGPYVVISYGLIVVGFRDGGSRDALDAGSMLGCLALPILGILGGLYLIIVARYEAIFRLAAANAKKLAQGEIEPPRKRQPRGISRRPQMSSAASARFTSTAKRETLSADDYYKKGCVAEEQGRVAEAMGHYRVTVRLKADCPEAQYRLANLLCKENRHAQAVQHYEEAVRLRPVFPLAHYKLGNVLFRQKKVEEAAQHYREALKARRNFLQAHYNLGVALEMQGKTDEAIEEYRAVIEIRKDHPGAGSRLATLLNKRQ